MTPRAACAALFFLSFLAAAHAAPTTTGVASWYGRSFARHRMADGARFDPSNAAIAANRTLPLGTRILVTNLGNGRSLVMRVCDRGPYARHHGKLERTRVLDVSRRAAELLGFKERGTARVRVLALPAVHRMPAS